MKYPDNRAQMHPGVAGAVPQSPEALAIVHGQSYKAVAFGGLVTRLGELGAIDLTDMSAVRADVCEILDLTEDIFSELLQDSSLIPLSTADTWTSDYRRRGEKRLKQETFNEAKEHFAQVIGKDVTDEQKQELRVMTADARAAVERIQQEIDEFRVTHPDFPPIRKLMQLNNILEPRLRRLESSTHAINLIDLANELAGDPLLAAPGENFAQKVQREFGYSGIADSLILNNFVEYMSEYRNGLSEEDISQLGVTWLPSEDVIDCLAAAYTNIYYEPYNREAPGRDAMNSLPNPLAAAFFVSEQERESFYQAYPIAKDQRPRFS